MLTGCGQGDDPTSDGGGGGGNTTNDPVEPATAYSNGGTQYNAHCLSCHGPGGAGGSQTLIKCIDSVTYYEKVNSGGSMSGYASSMSAQDKADVLYYLDNPNMDTTYCGF